MWSWWNFAVFHCRGDKNARCLINISDPFAYRDGSIYGLEIPGFKKHSSLFYAIKQPFVKVEFYGWVIAGKSGFRTLVMQ